MHESLGFGSKAERSLGPVYLLLEILISPLTFLWPTGWLGVGWGPCRWTEIPQLVVLRLTSHQGLGFHSEIGCSACASLLLGLQTTQRKGYLRPPTLSKPQFTFLWGKESFVFKATSYHLPFMEWGALSSEGSPCAESHPPALVTLPGQAPPHLCCDAPTFLKTDCWAPHSPVQCELPMPGLKSQRAETIFFESACSTTQAFPTGDRVRK